MYDLNDTIVAVSSPSGGVRSIVRLTGPQTRTICGQVFEPERDPQIPDLKARVLSGQVRIDDNVAVDAWLYRFFAPHSYTGEDLAELHVQAGPVLVEALVRNLLARGLRAAGPGEFTARAYLNGKLDLAQAEAVNEVISSSNRLQLQAAEDLLRGRLTRAAEQIHSDLLDVLSRIEAGLDFSGEHIEFISTTEAADRLTKIHQGLKDLLAGSIRCEALIDLPAVGIAGAPNAGKSSLLNALLGWERSIVSAQAKTTRDVLTGVLTTDRLQCVLFDCAGLIPPAPLPSGASIEVGGGRLGCLDELAQRAAIDALERCSAVLFCVDVTKPDTRDDLVVRSLIRPRDVICVATKSDLLSPEELSTRTQELMGLFGAPFLPVSSKMSEGLANLLGAVERSLAGRAVPTGGPEETSTLALTARHRQAVTEAAENIRQAVAEVKRGDEEVAAMTIRSACQAIAQIEQEPIDEQVLDRIFSRFCIGK